MQQDVANVMHGAGLLVPTNTNNLPVVGLSFIDMAGKLITPAHY